MPPGLLFHLLFMILWVRNLSTAYLCTRLGQLLDWWWQIPGDPAHVSGVLVLAVGWGALVFRWPFALQMLSHQSVIQPKHFCLVAGLQEDRNGNFKGFLRPKHEVPWHYPEFCCSKQVTGPALNQGVGKQTSFLDAGVTVTLEEVEWSGRAGCGHLQTQFTQHEEFKIKSIFLNELQDHGNKCNANNE